MTHMIAYGLDTDSIEDAGQMVLLDLPDECAELDVVELSYYLDKNWDPQWVHSLVPANEAIEAVTRSLIELGIDPTTVVAAVRSAALDDPSWPPSKS